MARCHMLNEIKITMKNLTTTVRFDTNTLTIIKNLSKNSGFNQSQILRRAVQLLNRLYELEHNKGYLMVKTNRGEERIFLLS